MTARLPLVLGDDGLPQRLQTTDSLDVAVQGPAGFQLVGGDDGDYAGVNVTDLLMQADSGEALNVRVTNPATPPPADNNQTQWYGGSVVGSGPMLDTTGYQSIVVGFSGANGTFLFQTSNDPAQFTGALSNAAGWSSAGGATPVTTVAAAAGAVYIFPATGRFFRLYCSVAGAVGPITIELRTAPAAQVINAQNVNLATLAGTAPVNAGVAGTLSVGGNIAVGTTPTLNPIPLAVDTAGLTRRLQTDASGNVNVTAPLNPGWTLGQYNITYSGYSTAQSSLSAALSTVNPVLTGGVDSTQRARRALTDQNGAAMVSPELATSMGNSQLEIFTQILAALKTTNFFLSELARREGGVMDDPDVVMNEYITATNPN